MHRLSWILISMAALICAAPNSANLSPDLAQQKKAQSKPQDEARFESTPAKDAQRAYRQARRRAESNYQDALKQARAGYVAGLEKALKTALAGNALDEALSIRLEQRKIQGRVDDINEVRRLLRTVAAGKFKEHVWKAGQAPIKLVRADEGFAFLSGVGGAYDGDGEGVSVYVKNGDWYIGGKSMQVSLWAKAMVVRFK